MVYTRNRPQMFRKLHRELLRRATATPHVPEWTDESGSVSFRSAEVGGREMLVVTLAAAPHELLSDDELGAILDMSPRQTSVARLLARRMTNPEIAADLNLTESTVRRHTEHVFLRLNVRKRAHVEEAVRQRVMDALYPRHTARAVRRDTAC